MTDESKINSDIDKVNQYWMPCTSKSNHTRFNCLKKLQPNEDCRCPKASQQSLYNKESVHYQALKINAREDIADSNENPCNYEGVAPLRNGEDYKCKFLNDWIGSKNAVKSSPEYKTKCKFLIVITMYNEGAKSLHNTLEGIFRELKHFDSGSEYKASTTQIGCVIIVDGIEPFLKSYNEIKLSNIYYKKKCARRNALYFSQFFNLDIINEEFFTVDIAEKNDGASGFEIINTLHEAGIINKEKEEISHCFFQTIANKEKQNLNLIFCVKQLNNKKLNSHLWFLKGFCKTINPKYLMFLDAGTKPKEYGLYRLYEAMEKNCRIAGCCGEIVPIISWNLIVLAQVVEYKFSHIFDKALESVTGYVSVLPGAFSAYRFKCVNEKTVLDAYFKSQRQGLDLSDANMYLAEDRVLCLELICQSNKVEDKLDGTNILRYVKNSIAKTDVPKKLHELMAQRRRWINGSWFAMVHTIRNCERIKKSNHTCCRKFVFKLLMFYFLVTTMFNWVLVGAFYLAFSIGLKRITNEETNNGNKLQKLSTPFMILHVSLLLCIIVTSLGVKPIKIKNCYKSICVVYGFFTYAAIVLIATTSLYNKDDVFTNDPYILESSAVFLILLASMFLILIIFNCAYKPIIVGIFPFIFMTVTYVNLFMIYAICNTHDFSWGNRPDKESNEEKARRNEYRNARSRWLILWIICNAVFAYLVNYLNASGNGIYIAVLGYIFYFITFIRFIGGIVYLIDECCNKCYKNEEPEELEKLKKPKEFEEFSQNRA